MSVLHRGVWAAGIAGLIAICGCSSGGGANSGLPTAITESSPSAAGAPAKPSGSAVPPPPGQANSGAGAGSAAAAPADLLNQFQTAFQQSMIAAQRDTKSAAEPVRKAAGLARQLIASGQKTSPQHAQAFATTFYNEACVESLMGTSDAAVKILGEAIDAGWNDLDHIATDHDLDPIRNTPGFKALIEGAASKIAAAAKQHAQDLIASNKSFSFDFSLPDLDGKTVSLKDYAGKVVIVDFWGTWCPPCRAEIPHFVALQEKYREAGLQVVGLTFAQTGGGEPVERVRPFAESNRINYPCLIGETPVAQQVPGFRAFPTTLFLDRAGNVRLTLVGGHSRADLEAVVAILLEEKSGAPAAN